MRQVPQLRPYNLEGGKTMRDLNPEGTIRLVWLIATDLTHACTHVHSDVDQLISIRGMVIRISSVIPEPSVGTCSGQPGDNTCC